MAEAHPFLRGGFRPFFFGGTAWGLVIVTCRAVRFQPERTPGQHH